MPFTPALRSKLSALKEEYDSGILPKAVYEEMCRKEIDLCGENMLTTEIIISGMFIKLLS